MGWQEKMGRFREYVFAEVERCLEEDGHCKTYEGAVSVVWPNYFEAQHDDPPQYGLTLDCYLIGPTRHYAWWAPSFCEALDMAMDDVRVWCEGGNWADTHWQRARDQEREEYQRFVAEMEGMET